jgi:hypothetical protein
MGAAIVLRDDFEAVGLRRRAGRGCLADDEDASAVALCIRSTVCCMDGSDAQRSFDGRKEQARHHHSSRRRGAAMHARGRRYRRRPSLKAADQAASR